MLKNDLYSVKKRRIDMKFKGVRKIHQGKFITRYDLEYETEDGNEKIYEMISRSPEIKSFDDLCSSRADAVVMIIHDENGEKLLLNREYRMATGQWIINFPAGLIDPGETADIAAQRELHEETGLRLLHIDEVWKESYSAIGFSNEIELKNYEEEMQHLFIEDGLTLKKK